MAYSNPATSPPGIKRLKLSATTVLDRFLFVPTFEMSLGAFQKRILTALKEHTTKAVLAYGDQINEPTLMLAILSMRYLPNAWLPRLLLELGADPMGKDSMGRTPLHQCALVIFALTREYGNDAADPELMTALNEVYQVARMLVDRGTPLDAVDEDGKTATELVESSTSAGKKIRDAIVLTPAFRNAFGLSTTVERA